jgi:uncharacterized membrane protein
MKELIANFYFALEWRIIATLITFFASYIVSGSFTLSLGIASVEAVIKIVVQMVWLKYRVKRGYKKLPQK